MASLLVRTHRLHGRAQKSLGNLLLGQNPAWYVRIRASRKRVSKPVRQTVVRAQQLIHLPVSTLVTMRSAFSTAENSNAKSAKAEVTNFHEHKVFFVIILNLQKNLQLHTRADRVHDVFFTSQCCTYLPVAEVVTGANHFLDFDCEVRVKRWETAAFVFTTSLHFLVAFHRSLLCTRPCEGKQGCSVADCFDSRLQTVTKVSPQHSPISGGSFYSC